MTGVPAGDGPSGGNAAMAHRTLFPTAPAPGRRHVLAGLATGVAAGLLPGTGVAADLLETPAFRARKAASALLLGVAAAGGRAVAVGERGIVVYSDDRGDTWRQAVVPVSVTLTAVHFPTAETGWAVGHDGAVLRSDDGGARWVRRFDGTRANALVAEDARAALAAARAKGDPTAVADAEFAVEDAQAAAEFGPSRPLLDLWFATAEQGFVVGSYGQIFHTADGGTTWRSLAGRMSNPNGMHLNAITEAADGTLLIAGEGGFVYRSTDHGGHWETQETGGPTNLFGVRRLDEARGRPAFLAFGFGGRIFRSTDARAWAPVDSPTTRSLIGSVMRDGELMLIDAAGSLVVSTDSGQSFTTRRGPGRAAVADALVLGGDRLITVGAGGAHVTSLAV